MVNDPAEHGRRSNAWRYGESSQWGQDEIWFTGNGDAIPVEEIEPDHLDRIISKIERGSNAAEIEGTPLMRKLREIDARDR